MCVCVLVREVKRSAAQWGKDVCLCLSQGINEVNGQSTAQSMQTCPLMDRSGQCPVTICLFHRRDCFLLTVPMCCSLFATFRSFPDRKQRIDVVKKIFIKNVKVGNHGYQCFAFVTCNIQAAVHFVFITPSHIFLSCLFHVFVRALHQQKTETCKSQVQVFDVLNGSKRWVFTCICVTEREMRRVRGRDEGGL